MIKSLNLSSATRWGLNLLGFLAGILALHLGQSILIPIIIALMLAAMLWPLVRGMHRFLHFSWSFSCMLAVGGLVIVNVLITLGFFLAVPKLLQDIPDLRGQEGQKQMYQKFREQVSKVVYLKEEDAYFPSDPENSRVFKYVKETLDNQYIAYAIFETFKFTNQYIWEWVLIMFVLLFMLVEGPMLSRRLVDIFGPNADTKDKAIHAFWDMAHHVRTYLVWRTIINFGIALLVGAVYQYVFHLKQAWVWGVLTAILFYVPYLGPLAAGIPPVIEAFITISPWAALAVMVIYVVIITIEGYLIVPVVMGHSMELNATTVMLACLFWELVWGLPGLFLAMPLMAAIKAICINVPEWRPLANLMSTSDAEIHTPPEELIVVGSMEETQILAPEDLPAIETKRVSLADKK